MTANVLRDAEVLPELRGGLTQSLGAYLQAVRSPLTEPWEAADPEALHAAMSAATDCSFWRSLALLGDDRAAALGMRLVGAACEPT